MARREIFICIAFAALVFASEVDDSEQKKRGAGKANVLNAIPTGAQKPEYTYNIYQNPAQSTPAQTYQAQIPNSFYPNQPSQYYSNGDAQTAHIPQTSHFVPINFVPNNGYQQKYQIVPKQNVQLAVVQQPTPYPSILQYPQMVLANPSNHINPQSPIQFPNGHFNFPQYQLPVGNPFIGHPLFVPPNIYGNVGVPNQPQGVVSYYQPQTKQNYSPSSSTDYDKLHTQSASPKEDTDIQNDYISSDSNSAFKNTYNSARSTYTKIN
ncbi:unnamed protein product [Leptosia nina]|uniref:Uncharacterized protein n=1 Tax=Leptosia nina TaxID=320188 RepID=A0AAV1J0S4_9NEOP